MLTRAAAAAPRLLGYPTANAVGPYCRCEGCEAIRRFSRRHLAQSFGAHPRDYGFRNPATRYDGTWGWDICPDCRGDSDRECEECHGDGIVPVEATSCCGHLVPSDFDGKPLTCEGEQCDGEGGVA